MLERLYIVEDQPAWEPHLRSQVNLRRSPKRHLVDPSLAVAALGADPQALMRDLNLLLLKFARKIDTDKVGEPATLAVIVATGYGYVREDGIQVIPIAALGP